MSRLFDLAIENHYHYNEVRMKRSNAVRIVLCVSLFLYFARGAFAQEALPQRSEARIEHEHTAPKKRFTTLSFSHTADALYHSNAEFAPSSRSTGFANLTKLGLDFDLSSLGAESSHFFIEGMGIQTSSALTARMPVQPSSNIAASNGFLIDQAYFAVTPTEKSEFALGIFDFNQAFYATDAASLFLNGTFGVGAEMSSSTLSIVPTFPTTSLGARVHAPIAGEFSVDAGIMNASPVALNAPVFNRFRLQKTDRLIGALQLNSDFSIREQGGSAALGFWTMQSPDNPSRETSEKGAYASLSQKIYSPRRGDDSGLYSFGRAGAAFGSTFTIDRTLSAGLAYRGLFQSAARDELGLAVAWAHRPNSARTIVSEDESSDPQFFCAGEQIAELSYRIQVVKGLSVQPDIQASRHTQFAHSNADQIVFGTRIQGQF